MKSSVRTFLERTVLMPLLDWRPEPLEVGVACEEEVVEGVDENIFPPLSLAWGRE